MSLTVMVWQPKMSETMVVLAISLISPPCPPPIAGGDMSELKSYGILILDEAECRNHVLTSSRRLRTPLELHWEVGRGQRCSAVYVKSLPGNESCLFRT